MTTTTTTTTTDFAPTDEQRDALERFATKADLVIEAGAGTGKTSTLRLLAESTDRRGLYVAFNKAIVLEAEAKMPRNVTCKTAHALAYAAVGKNYRGRLGAPRVKSTDVAKALRIDPITVQGPSGEKRLAAGYLAGHVQRALSLFCQSADDEPTAWHFPYIDGIDVPLPDGRRGRANNSEVARWCLPALLRAFDDIKDPNAGVVPFKHEHYLKLWQLSKPALPAEFILFDEAQDASPVMRAVIEDQHQAQLIFVGDSQQAIYGFTGAVNALEELATTNRTMLRKSFRFGPEVAEVANRVLARLEADLRIEGAGAPGMVAPASMSPEGKADVILCRTNASCVRRALDELADGGKPAIVGGADDVVRFARAAEDLRSKGWTSHPDLACFKTWGEVQDYVETDPSGSDLSLLVRLIDEFGADVIVSALAQCCDEKIATLVVSTAHKAKGREWDTVELAGDFPTGFDKEGKPVDVSPEELRLLYVAATRARLHLDTGGNPILVGSLPGTAGHGGPAEAGQ